MRRCYDGMVINNRGRMTGKVLLLTLVTLPAAYK